MKNNERDILKEFLDKNDVAPPPAPPSTFSQILAKAGSSFSILNYWPQVLATGLALLAILFAFRGPYNSKIQTDDDLAAFISETYMRDFDQDLDAGESVGEAYLNLID